MGEMADDLIFSCMDDLFEDYEDQSYEDFVHEPLPRTCRVCGTPNLWWRWIDTEGWRLHAENGKRHYCSVHEREVQEILTRCLVRDLKKAGVRHG